ncbi:uncharacterized protein LOC123534375 isoform X2 [Mercenaria mercenaria]|uniref:uncharacterized protein LOC123534375 isoform X2 n=1 Tax=Mercenaria mercenaria TaxID=6596 RepID=UPI00234F431A|nr:uncharacterized protein LOC123534375 isoform X2 [Mercenaria mercenaria]
MTIYIPLSFRVLKQYLRCKNHFILRRKHDIKDMIEGCNDDSVMLKFQQLSTCESQHRENNPPRGLVAAARQYREAAEEMRVFEEIQSEVEHLNTEELQRQIRITNNELSEMKRKFERLYQELISLKEGYEASNQMFISLRRYSERKRILKAFITQNTDAFPGSLVPLSGD